MPQVRLYLLVIVNPIHTYVNCVLTLLDLKNQIMVAIYQFNKDKDKDKAMIYKRQKAFITIKKTF